MNEAMPDGVTYQELLDRYGTKLAYDVLVLLEKTARVPMACETCLDEEARLRRALDALQSPAPRAA